MWIASCHRKASNPLNKNTAVLIIMFAINYKQLAPVSSRKASKERKVQNSVRFAQRERGAQAAVGISYQSQGQRSSSRKSVATSRVGKEASCGEGLSNIVGFVLKYAIVAVARPRCGRRFFSNYGVFRDYRVLNI